jgi:hypothetical protein
VILLFVLVIVIKSGLGFIFQQEVKPTSTVFEGNTSMPPVATTETSPKVTTTTVTNPTTSAHSVSINIFFNFNG